MRAAYDCNTISAEKRRLGLQPRPCILATVNKRTLRFMLGVIRSGSFSLVSLAFSLVESATEVQFISAQASLTKDYPKM